MVGLAALNFVRNNKSGAYFFHDEKYVRINWTPGRFDDEITTGPKDFYTTWLSLKDAGFSRIDAILPIPGYTDRAYFFSGDKYATFQYTVGGGDSLLGRIHPLSEWGSLVQAGFKQVDAVCPVPGKSEQAYFFSGNEYARVSYNPGSSSPDALLEGPYLIREHWPNLGAPQIDRLITDPSSPDKAYVFYKTDAWHIQLVPGGGIDVVHGPTKAAEYWQSLHKAGFY